MSGSSGARIVINTVIRRMRRVRTAGLCTGLMALLVLGAGGAGGAVLCLGADGHVTVEASPDGSCGGSSDVSSRTDSRLSPENISSSAKCCFSPCADIPLSAGTSDQRFVPGQYPQKQIPGPRGFVRASSTLDDFGHADIYPAFCSPTVDTMLVSLRTVVLLI